ncbi:hypothetical protein BDV09DRAFT_163865 [Aspergillus tetrazonus]
MKLASSIPISSQNSLACILPKSPCPASRSLDFPAAGDKVYFFSLYFVLVLLRVHFIYLPIAVLSVYFFF